MVEPKAGSKIINDEFLTQKTVGILLHEIFSLNEEENEEKNGNVCQKKWFINFAIVYGKRLTINNLRLLEIVDFGEM